MLYGNRIFIGSVLTLCYGNILAYALLQLDNFALYGPPPPHTHARTHIYARTHAHICTHAHIYARARAHTHTHTHTHTLRLVSILRMKNEYPSNFSK